jgi:hypothetical protein
MIETGYAQKMSILGLVFHILYLSVEGASFLNLKKNIKIPLYILTYMCCLFLLTD